MSSFPHLSQKDILQLLTLGITSSISKNLGDKERASVATLSIGGLVMNQLGINQNLKDNLGLQLQLVPDFEDENLLEGTAETLSSISGKIKSSSKIQLRKKINRNIDLSISNRLNNTGQDKRKISVDIKMKEDFSLKGIYEIRSVEDLENEDLESFGIDFIKKFKF